MSDDTPLLNLPLLQPAQAQKHVTHNEALRLLDITVQLAVLDRDLNAPPATPSEGDRYIIGPAPTGEWQGRAGQIAAFWGGIWVFLPPADGWQARLLDESVTLAFQGGLWSPATILPETFDRLGIVATPDTTNRLAVSAPASLFSHAGDGHQMKINKATPADTASLLFQTAFSGRAEMGLTGSDAFALRVSADGTTFSSALTANPATGTLAAPQGFSAPFQMIDTVNPTKRATFDIASLPAGAQRTYSLPNVSSEIATLAGTQTFSGTKSFSGTLTVTGSTATIGTATANASYGLGTGTTASGASKSVDIGTGGGSGSTTTVTIGSAIAGAGGTLTLNSPTVTLGATVTQFDMGSASARATAIGIGGATGDGTNRLSVNSPGILFNHAGSSIETSINKADPASQGMVSFKTGFSTRAQIGLLGNDDLALRVSPDGSTFSTVLSAEATTGRASFPQPVILQGLPADPLNPADGTVWHGVSSGHISTRLAGQTVHLDGQQNIPFLVPPAGELIATVTGAGGTATLTSAGAAGRIDLFPFLPRADLTIDRLVLNCTTAVAGALARVTLYASDAQGRPGAFLAETADIDLGTVGAKFATIAQTLRQGRTIWLGLRTSSTATVSAWPASATPDINGGAAPSTGLRKVLRRNLAWTAPAPATWGFTSAEISGATAPAIWMRVL